MSKLGNNVKFTSNVTFTFIKEQVTNEIAEAVNAIEHSFISAINKLNVRIKDSENTTNEINQLKHSNAFLTEKLHKNINSQNSQKTE